ncbi:uncharacterized protein [Dermacentor andersoni]|uniref:uncharacterized protein n=1 Tax=Dermacentor andersoni TaxID=34620 RepID=UPI0024178E52|nr:uncharacterized protein LOC126534643 [Dermacentor andersoni]XP_054928504.1 uncharacterized protein LOC126534643 [Dermacentor andersoni]
MFINRRCGVLLGAVVAAVVVCSCEAAPSASKGALKDAKPGASTQSTALVVVPLETLPGPTTHDNATAANETIAHNATTVPPAAANQTVPVKVPNTTMHEGDAVLHYGGVSGGEVVKKPRPHTYFFTSWITWREDNYLMSILIPIGCGVAAAVLILCSLACIGCCRRRCRSRSRRKMHRKIDPKTFRKMKAADRIKLLAASSDEEF